MQSEAVFQPSEELICGTTFGLNVKQLLERIDSIALAVETGISFVADIEIANVTQALEMLAAGAEYLKLPYADKIRQAVLYLANIKFEEATDLAKQVAHAIRQFVQNVDSDKLSLLIEGLATASVWKIWRSYADVLKAFSKYIGPLLVPRKIHGQAEQPADLLVEIYHGIKILQLIGQWIKRRREKHRGVSTNNMLGANAGSFLMTSPVTDRETIFEFESITEPTMDDLHVAL